MSPPNVTFVERALALVSNRRPKNQSSSNVPRRSEAKTIPLTFALLPVVGVIWVVTGKSATAVFVSQTHIAKELQFSERRKQFPFFGAQIRNQFLDIVFSVISD